MTTQRWNDDRLDRLADRVEDSFRAIEALGQKIDNIANIADSNARVIQALANTAAEAREERQQILQFIAQQQQKMVEIDERIDRQQTNIDGLRTETIRMLDILLNQRNQQDSSGE